MSVFGDNYPFIDFSNAHLLIVLSVLRIDEIKIEIKICKISMHCLKNRYIEIRILFVANATNEHVQFPFDISFFMHFKS